MLGTVKGRGNWQELPTGCAVWLEPLSDPGEGGVMAERLTQQHTQPTYIDNLDQHTQSCPLGAQCLGDQSCHEVCGCLVGINCVINHAGNNMRAN